MKKIRLIILTIIVTLLLSSCGMPRKRDFPENDKYNIIATTTLVGDLVTNIGGDKVNVKSLMGPGVDPHDFKASAGDVALMHKADIIFYNGLNLEGKMGSLFENFQSTDKLIKAVSSNINEEELIDFETNPGHFDPHIWFSVNLWKKAAKEVKIGLQTLDEKNSKYYEKNYEEYIKELTELDEYIRKRVEELPEDKRVLVTAHDAFGYFGLEYGFQVRGLQGISTSAEAGTSDVSNLANYIVNKDIKAIFIESSLPIKNVEALQEAVKSQGHNVKIGGELYSDSTGSKGTEAETYIGTFKANIDTIVDSLK